MTDDPGRRTSYRLEAALVLVLCVGVLVVAALLPPDPAGYGTHRRLLLVPCLFRTITHLPCPFCGLTTSYTAMARLRVAEAFAAHALGPIAYLLTWVVGARAAYALVRGVPLAPAWLSGKRTTVAVLIVLSAGWVVNIVRALLR